MTVASDVSEFYLSSLAEHGATAEGVGWRDQLSQEKRFSRLLNSSALVTTATLLDVGCGMGALVGYLQTRFPIWFNRVRYTGIDVMPEYIKIAREKYGRHEDKPMAMDARVFGEWDVRKVVELHDPEDPDEQFDYVMASGVMSHHTMTERIEIVDAMWSLTHRVLAFNIPLQDAQLRDLALILPRFGTPMWTIDHDYGLDEATVIVRRKS